jgi:hypothetical protein
MRASLLTSAGFSIAILFAGLAPALAGTACYEDQLVEASIGCNGSSGNSADFAGSCKGTEAQWVQVEVACPAMWVNTVGDSETQEQTCKRVGLKPARVEGTFCASGEHQPSTGQDWESISYRYGRFGGKDTLGGDFVRTEVDRTVRAGRDGMESTIKGGKYCYHSSDDKKENDSTDRLVAYVCGP